MDFLPKNMPVMVETTARKPTNRILFFAGNGDNQLASYIPVMRVLRGHEDMKFSVFYSETFTVRSRSGSNETLEMTKEIADEFIEYSGPAQASAGWGNPISWWRTGRILCREIAEVLAATNPALVVIPNNEAFRNRVASKLSALAGVPVLVLLDGAVPGGLRSRLKSFPVGFRIKYYPNALAKLILSSIGMLGLSNLESIFKHNVGHASVTKMAVWGNRSREVALQHGFTESQVEAIGTPKFDEIAVGDWAEKAVSLYARLGVARSEKRVVFLPTKGFDNSFFETQQQQIGTYESMVAAVDDLTARGNGTVRLIVKLHRQENIDKFRALVPSSVLERAIVVQDVPLYPLLYGCHIAVTVASVAGLEALLFDKGLITLNFSGRPDFRNYARSGAAVGVYTPGALKEAIEQVLENDELRQRLAVCRARFVADQVSDLDGGAGQRAADLVISMIYGTRRGQD